MNPSPRSLLALALLASLPLAAQPPAAPAAPSSALPAPRARVSPHETISTVIGDPRTGNRVTITYGRPYSKDPKSAEIRKVWGGVVPWEKAYRLGSDEATLLLTQQPISFGETTIPAGAYTLYLVPSETGVTKLAISTNIAKWGVPVDEKHDLARVDVKKEPMETQLDQLTLAIANDPATGGGTLIIAWEKTKYSVAFTVKK